MASSHRRPKTTTPSSINCSRPPPVVEPLDPSIDTFPNRNSSVTILTTSELASTIGSIWKAIGYQHKAERAKASIPLRDQLVSFGSKSPRSLETTWIEIRETKRSLLFGTGRGRPGSADVHRGMRGRVFDDLMGLVNGGRSGKESSNGVSCGLPSLSVDNVVSCDDSVVCSHDLESDATSMRSVSRSAGLGSNKDHHIDFLVSYDNAIRESRARLSCLSSAPDEVCDSGGGAENVDYEVRSGVVSSEEEGVDEVPISVKDRLRAAFAKRKYALSGAMAGTFVSLCLHPVDTVKTVIQARSGNQMSIHDTFRSIVSERGIMGLYRGIATNITFSAPISAVYTYTYETIKGVLLPLLPKECHSFAHCTAGGCASIATSFIFTPSERIKQQMQVRSHYQNCWSALVGILKKGGLSSLYTGWGAVLCRNVPHSIIKFYTYESLKQFFLPSSQADKHLSTLETLLCGGIAGSTAAMFTTPFDVVKTRLQTQMPGSFVQHNGVFGMLQQIARHEGVSGLYRGLGPRLAMYVSQGAIFFASYEFFKVAFSLDVPSGLPANV